MQLPRFLTILALQAFLASALPQEDQEAPARM